jgi:micrococcal nuclease
MIYRNRAIRPSACRSRISRTDFVAKTFTVLLLFSVIALPIQASAWQGKVVGVSDGDTITVMHDGKGEKIRLYGVDCPEKRQDYGSKAKQFASDMVFGRSVDVKKMDTDRYGRTVAVVTIDGKVLNAELLKSGMAWIYVQCCKQPFCDQWKQYQERAKSEKVGLWSMPNPIAPWNFRHTKKGVSP